ncbi:MAG: DivIVA domain-containing protein, partial [Acidimicrobiales bacterium]
MGLTPEEIERRDFASTLRGYDRDEVRSFLKKVGD